MTLENRTRRNYKGVDTEVRRAGGTLDNGPLTAGVTNIVMSPGNGRGLDTPLPAGTLSNLRVRTDQPPGSGEIHTFIVVVNDVATAITCTISDPNTSCEDTTNSVTIAAGDRLWVFAIASGSAMTTEVSWSLTHTAP